MVYNLRKKYLKELSETWNVTLKTFFLDTFISHYEILITYHKNYIEGKQNEIYLCTGLWTSKPTHPAGTSKDSDKCDLSKDSEIAPLTLGSMENTTYFISHRKPI